MEYRDEEDEVRGSEGPGETWRSGQNVCPYFSQEINHLKDLIKASLKIQIIF